VRIQVQGDPHLTMPKHLAYDLRVHALAEQQGSSGMPEIMERERRPCGCIAELPCIGSRAAFGRAGRFGSGRSLTLVSSPSRRPSPGRRATCPSITFTPVRVPKVAGTASAAGCDHAGPGD